MNNKKKNIHPIVIPTNVEESLLALLKKGISRFRFAPLEMTKVPEFWVRTRGILGSGPRIRKSKFDNWQLKIAILALLLPLTALAMTVSVSRGGSTTGLVGHWELREESETVTNGNPVTADSTVNNNDGTIYGATYTAGPTAEGLGPELVTNGGFDTDSDWNKYPEWTISDGTANCDGSQTATVLLYQPGIVGILDGKKYLVQIDITEYSAGRLRIWQGSSPGDSYYYFPQTIGTHTHVITSFNYPNFNLSADADFIGSVDNVSVREVISGQALDFDGTNDYVDVGNITKTVNSISFWVKSTTTSEDIMDLDGGTHTIEVGSGTITATGFSSPTIYVDGSISSTLDTNWRHVVIMTATGFTADNLKIGKETTYFNGSIADVKIFNHALTADEVTTLYEGGSNAKSKVLSDKKGMVGHWSLNKKSVQSDTRSLDNSSAGASYVASGQAYGTWEFDVYKGGDGNSHVLLITSSSSNPSSGISTGYEFYIYSDESIRLAKYGIINIAYTAKSYVDNNAWYRIKIERTRDGTFTIYIKGDGKIGTAYPNGSDDYVLVDVTGGSGTNPVTDNTYTTSSYMVADLDSGDKIRGVWTSGVGGIPVSDFTDGTGTTSVTGNLVVADETVTGNDGTVYNAVITPAGEPTGTFDGVDDYVDTGTDMIGAGDVTVTGWIKPSSYGEGAGRILDNGKFMFYVRSTDAQLGTTSIGGDFIYSANNSIELNEWQFVSVTRTSAGTTNFYIGDENTPPASSGTADQTSGTPVVGISNLLIGNRDDNDRTFDGDISDLRIFNKILTPLEIEQVYQGQTITDGLAGWWPLAEGAGDTAFDASTNANHGTIENATLSSFWANTQTVAPFNQKEGYSNGLYFDGVDDDINLGNDSSLTPTSALSISAWVKPNGIQNNYTGIIGNQGSNNGYMLRYGSNNTFNSRIGNGSTYDNIYSTGSTPSDKWTHVVITYDGSQYIYYFNGSGETPVIATINSVAYSTVTARIGSELSLTDRFFDGNISDARIYNRALNAGEVADIYNHQTVSSGLVGQWLLDEGTGTTANDTISTNDGTISGAAWTKLPVNAGYNSSWWKGKQVMQFGGSHTIDFPDSIIGLTSLSWWVNPATIASKTMFMNTGGTRTVQGDASGYLQVYPSTVSTVPIDINTWQHFVLAHDGSGYKIYKNGIYQETITGAVLDLDQIGRESGNGVIGSMSDVRIYDTALSSTEITKLYNHQDVSDGLVAHYPLDTNNTDNTGYASFDGLTDHINCGNDTSLDITDAITIETWVKPNSYDIHYPLFLSKGSNVYRIGLNGIGLGKLFFRLTIDGVAKDSTSTSVVPIGQWSQVVGTYDGSFMKIYINGVLARSPIAQTGSIDTTTLPLIIGAYSAAGQYSFDGSISGVKLYDRALSSSEISSLYHNQDVTTDLIGHWPLETDYNDDVGSNNGTNSGSTLISLPRTSMDAVGSNDGIIQEAIPKTYLNSEVDVSSAALQIKPVGRWLEQSMYFDGVGDYVNTGLETAAFGTDDFTISSWIKTNDLTSYQGIFTSRGGGVETGFYYMLDTTGKALLGINTGSTINVAATNAVTKDWNHVVIVADRSGNATHYLNGVINGSGSISAQNGNVDNATDKVIGARKRSTGTIEDYFDGYIADTRIYDRALNATEVAQLYQTSTPDTSSPKGSLQKGLVGYWPLKSKYETTGAELVTNGTFDADSDWMKGTGWTISGGTANFDASQLAKIQQDNVYTIGKKSILEFTVTGDNPARLGLSNSGITTVSYAPGTHQLEVNPISTTFIIYGYTGFPSFSIDNISFKEITTADTTPQSNHGSLVNGPTVGSDYTSFDGVDDYVSVSSPISAGNEITISMWAKVDISGSDSVFWFADANGRVAQAHILYGGGAVYWDCGVTTGNSYDRITKDSSGLLGTWHNWIFTKNAISGFMGIYLDGELWHSGTGKTKPITTTDVKNYIGRGGEGAWFDGDLADVRIYDRALTNQEAQQLYEQGR